MDSLQQTDRGAPHCPGCAQPLACDHDAKYADIHWEIHEQECPAISWVSDPSVAAFAPAGMSRVVTKYKNPKGRIEYFTIQHDVPVVFHRESLNQYNPFSRKRTQHTNYRGRKYDFNDDGPGVQEFRLEVTVWSSRVARQERPETGITSEFMAQVPRDMIGPLRNSRETSKEAIALAKLRRFRKDDRQKVIFFHELAPGMQGGEFRISKMGNYMELKVTDIKESRQYTVKAEVRESTLERRWFRLNKTATRELEIKGISPRNGIIIEAVDPHSGVGVRMALEMSRTGDYASFRHGIEITIPDALTGVLLPDAIQGEKTYSIGGGRLIRHSATDFTCDIGDEAQVIALAQSARNVLECAACEPDTHPIHQEHDPGAYRELEDAHDLLVRYMISFRDPKSNQTEFDEQEVQDAARICLKAAFMNINGFGTKRSLRKKRPQELLILKERWMNEYEQLVGDTTTVEKERLNRAAAKSYFGKSVNRMRISNLRNKLKNLRTVLTEKAAILEERRNDGDAKKLRDAAREIDDFMMRV